MADGKIVIGTEIDYRKFDKQIDELDKKASVLETKISDPKKYNIDITKAEADLEKIKNKIEVLNKKSLEVGLKNVSNIEFNPDRIKKFSNGKLQMQEIGGSATKLNGQLNYVAKNLKDIKVEAEEVGKKGQEANNKNSILLSKNTKTLQRFAFRLLNVASIYSVVSKASSAYLSTNEELANKLQSVWVGLGSFLAPTIEMISDALLKALGYLNVFVKALSGGKIDAIANANAKALQKQASAQKDLNKQTQQYDFDVIRTQQSTSSSGGVSSGSSGLIEIPELDENLVRKLQEMAKWLKENWHWIKEVGKVLLVTFGAVKISKVLAGIASLLSGANGAGGLLKLSSVLKGLLTIGTIAIGVDLLYKGLTGKDLIEDLKGIKNGLDEIKQSTEANTRQDRTYTEGLKSLGKTMKERIQAGNLTNEQLKASTDLLKSNSSAILNQIMNIENQTIITKAMKEEEMALVEQMQEVVDQYSYLYQQGLLNQSQTYDYIDAIDQQIRIMKTLGQDTSHLEETYKSLTGRTWNVNVNTNIDRVKNGVFNFFDYLDDELRKERTLQLATEMVGNALRGATSIFGFAKGGIVTQPTRALIGEAGYPEAVVPMTQDYLSTLASEIAKFGGNSGTGGTVNVYLDGRLIQRQMNNRQQQVRFSTNS
jgi:hypothetical protein